MLFFNNLKQRFYRVYPSKGHIRKDLNSSFFLGKLATLVFVLKNTKTAPLFVKFEPLICAIFVYFSQQTPQTSQISQRPPLLFTTPAKYVV